MTPAYNTMPSINFTIYKRPIYRKNILKNNEPKKSSKSDEKFSQHLMRPDHAPKFLLIPRRPPLITLYHCRHSCVRTHHRCQTNCDVYKEKRVSGIRHIHRVYITQPDRP